MQKFVFFLNQVPRNYVIVCNYDNRTGVTGQIKNIYLYFQEKSLKVMPVNKVSGTHIQCSKCNGR